MAKNWHMIFFTFVYFSLLFLFVCFLLFYFVHFAFVFILFLFCFYFVHFHYLILFIVFFSCIFFFISFRFLKWNQKKTILATYVATYHFGHYDYSKTAYALFTGRSVLSYFLRLNCYNFRTALTKSTILHFLEITI